MKFVFVLDLFRFTMTHQNTNEKRRKEEMMVVLLGLKVVKESKLGERYAKSNLRLRSFGFDFFLAYEKKVGMKRRR